MNPKRPKLDDLDNEFSAKQIEKEDSDGTSRRDFIKITTGAIGASALIAAGCKEKNKGNECSKAQDIINPATFEKGSFDQFANTFGIIFSSKFGLVHYFNIEGKLLKTVKLPQNWYKLSQKQKQAWHNTNRKALKDTYGSVLPSNPKCLGYPFVAVPSSEHESKSKNTMLKVVEKRLDTKHRDKRYFKGKSKTIPQAISIIANEYGISPDLVLAIGAQESNYYKYRSSSANAKGIFQLIPGTKNAAGEGYRYRIKNPSFRKGKINVSDNKELHNRFIQIEIFCSYYRLMKRRLRKKIQKLNRRIRKIDNIYSGINEEIVLSAAFNAGSGRISDCIEKFVNLNDAQIKQKLGKPPYDSNVMLGVISTSFGTNSVGSDVMFYCSKVEGWRKLLRHKALSEAGSTRRGFLATMTGAIGVAALNAAGCLPKEKSKPSINSKEVKEIVDGSKLALNKRYKKLRLAVKNTRGSYKIGNLTREELKEVRNKDVYIGSQVKMLMHHFKKFLDKPLKDNRISRSWNRGAGRKRMMRACRRKRKCWNDAKEEHAKWRKDQIKSGELVKMKERSKSKPYFCQQVGKNSGVHNAEYAMYIDKEWEPILEAMVHLVNHQIDLFNKNPESYGYSGFKIDHVDAVKISGAFRSLQQQYVSLKSASRTSDLSAHLTGRAIDIGALAPIRNDAKIVRFKNGKYLSAAETSNPRRKILSKMIGRAFLSMKKPLAKHGINIKTLWEGRPQNWHVVIGAK